MTKRQYLVQHILHLSARLSHIRNPKEKENTEQALLFYAKELHAMDKKQNSTRYIQ